MGEIFYSYIEIIDAKESIIDRVTVVSEPVGMPAAQPVAVGQATELSAPLNEEFPIQVTETKYVAQPIMLEPVPATPKSRGLPPSPPPDYFQSKPVIKKDGETKERKIKPVKNFRYPPKIEKIEIIEVKRTETYSRTAPLVEISKEKTEVKKIEHKARAKPKKMPKKIKRKKRKNAKITKKTPVKIKKVKAEIVKSIKKKRQGQILKKPKVKPVSKKKTNHKPEAKPVKPKKKKAKAANQSKVKKKKKELLKQPGKEVKQKRNKRNKHKRLHQMLV